MFENYDFSHKKTNLTLFTSLTNFPRTWPLEERSTTIKLLLPPWLAEYYPQGPETFSGFLYFALRFLSL